MNIAERLDGSSLTELTSDHILRDLRRLLPVGTTFDKVVVSECADLSTKEHIRTVLSCRVEDITVQEWQDTRGTDGSLTITTADDEEHIRLLYGTDVLVGASFAVLYLHVRPGQLLEEIVICRPVRSGD